MKKYIALLRGINVSGHHKIKMTDLKQLFEDLHFKNITTHIQSGNVIFTSSETTISKIETAIINAIKSTFNYDIKVLIIPKNEFETIFNSNPFIKKGDFDITKICVTFLREVPNLENVSQIEALILNNEDEFIINNKSIYLNCPSGFANTKLTNNLFERKLKTDATTRNWKTITRLVELSNL